MNGKNSYLGLKTALPAPELIVGLDVPDLKRAEQLVSTLGDAVDFYKIGYQLVFCGGLSFAQELVASGKKVFLDLKLLDIEQTVFSAVEAAVKLGVSMLTIHAYPHAMRAAVKAAHGSSLCLLGVTVLTCMEEEALLETGYHQKPQELVLKRAMAAQKIGMGGVVCSAQEGKQLRSHIGTKMLLVAPGIRLKNGDWGDQKRVCSPLEAKQAGVSHIVMARPIVEALDPHAVVAEVLQQLQEEK